MTLIVGWLQGFLGKHKNSLRTEVIEPAIKLSRHICCSQPEPYLRKPNDTLFTGRQTEPSGGSKTWELLNIGSWMHLKQEDAIGYFFCLLPGLYADGIEEPLVEPLIVAYRKSSATTP